MCYSSVCVSLCDGNKGRWSSLGNLLAKGLASELYLTYASKAKSKNLSLHEQLWNGFEPCNSEAFFINQCCLVILMNDQGFCMCGIAECGQQN